MSKTITVALVVLIVVGVVTLTLAEDWRDWTPLPEEVRVIPPDQNLRPEIAKLSGIWQGTWSVGTKTSIILEKLSTDEVEAVYAWRMESGREGWQRVKGAVEKNSIVLKWGNPVRIVTIKLMQNSRAVAEYTHTGENYSTEAKLERKQ